MSVTQGLEYCEERYSQELGGSAFPLRAQATNTRLLSCQTIEKFRPHPDRDDSMNEGEPASPETRDLWKMAGFSLSCHFCIGWHENMGNVNLLTAILLFVVILKKSSYLSLCS